MVFNLIKKFLPYNEGKTQLHTPGKGGPQGNPFGTALGEKPNPTIVRGPMWVVAPVYGSAATQWGRASGPVERAGQTIIAIPGYEKKQTYSDIQY